uniref:CD83 molecule n=1 Tax=Ailuropoda melanoleuca TaxID=9646 RepID=A0A7N5KL38_AILME
VWVRLGGRRGHPPPGAGPSLPLAGRVSGAPSRAPAPFAKPKRAASRAGGDRRGRSAAAATRTPGARGREVKVACSEAVDLPCTVHLDPQGPYRVFWVKLTERGEERLGVPQEGLQDHRQREDSFEAPGGRLHLKIQNASGCHSGTYRCTVEELDGQRNQSGTVTLKVTGCPKERKEETFQKYRAEIVLLLALVVFYLTLIIFTCVSIFLKNTYCDEKITRGTDPNIFCRQCESFNGGERSSSLNPALAQAPAL